MIPNTPITLTAPAPLVSREIVDGQEEVLVLDLDNVLGPPLELRVLTVEEEIEEADLCSKSRRSSVASCDDEPPTKRLKIDDQQHNSTTTTTTTTTTTIASQLFDQAFSGGDDPLFRANITEGSQHIIRRQEPDVQMGLALWSKALQRLLANKDEATSHNQTNNDLEDSANLEHPTEEIPPPPPLPTDTPTEQPEEKEPEEAPAEEQQPPTVVVTPTTFETDECVHLSGAEHSALQEALGALERLSFATCGLTFSYRAGQSLRIGDHEFYDVVNAVIVSVISKRGADLGQEILKFVQALVGLGLTLVERRKAVARTAARQFPPVPPADVRTARVAATLQAISRFGHNSDARRAAQAENAESPPSSLGFFRRPPPPTMAARFLTSSHVTPPPMDLTTAFWSDARMVQLPDWVISTLADLAVRYDGQILASVDQHWYSAYRSYLDFRLFGFTGLHEAISRIPGVSLRREGSDYCVQVNRAVLQEALRQRWPIPQARPNPGGPIPPDVMNSLLSQSRQVQASVGGSRVPPGLSAKLLAIVAANEGNNIGHIQQQFRKGYPNEKVDLAALGFAKFSDLLAEVPGVQVVKDGSTVTAHTLGAKQPLPVSQLALVLQLQLAALSHLSTPQS